MAILLATFALVHQTLPRDCLLLVSPAGAGLVHFKFGVSASCMLYPAGRICLLLCYVCLDCGDALPLVSIFSDMCFEEPTGYNSRH